MSGINIDNEHYDSYNHVIYCPLIKLKKYNVIYVRFGQSFLVSHNQLISFQFIKRICK